MTKPWIKVVLVLSSITVTDEEATEADSLSAQTVQSMTTQTPREKARKNGLKSGKGTEPISRLIGRRGYVGVWPFNEIYG